MIRAVGGDLSAFFAAFEEGHESADIDQNGGVEGGDLALFLAWHESGFAGDHTLDAQRFLYRGYHWDDALKMYHVRHRVYDPARMLWIQRDPLGRIPGANEYAYCLGEPIDFYDPMGLYSMSDWGQIGESFLEGAHDGLIATTQAMVNSAIETAELVSPIRMAADTVNTLEALGVDTGEAGEAIRDVREVQRDLKDEFNEYMQEGLIDPDNPDLEASRIAGQIAFIALEAAATGGGGTAKRAAQAAAKATGKATQAGAGCATAGGKAAPATQLVNRLSPQLMNRVKQMFPPKVWHKNSRNYTGEVHVYRIKAPDGSTYKIGESAQGVRLIDGASVRAEQQVRKLNRKHGPGFESEIRRIFRNKAEAQDYERRLIERFRRRFGEDALPGNKTNR